MGSKIAEASNIINNEPVVPADVWMYAHTHTHGFKRVSFYDMGGISDGRARDLHPLSSALAQKTRFVLVYCCIIFTCGTLAAINAFVSIVRRIDSDGLNIERRNCNK